jgi:AraC-like DNA-binding protein
MLPASAVRPIIDYVDGIGLPRSPRMERLAARLDDPGLVLPYSIGAALFEDAIRAGAGEDVGLRIGEALRIERLGPFGERLLRAPTVAAALELAIRQRHNTGQRFVLSRRGPDAWLERRVAASVQRGRAQEREMSTLAAIAVLRRAAGAGWRPSEIHFEGPPPAHAEELAGLATRGVRFGAAQTVLVFPAGLLALPLPRRDGDGALAAVPPPVAPTDLVGSLRATVRTLLQVGELALESAADAAGTSPRSLQRRLAGRGLSFAELVDDVRFRTACALLRDPHRKVVEVSAELGYTDSANFTRAFRRWAGVSPRSFRRALAEHALAS